MATSTPSPKMREKKRLVRILDPTNHGLWEIWAGLPKNLEPLDIDKDLGFHTGLHTGSFPSAGNHLQSPHPVHQLPECAQYITGMYLHCFWYNSIRSDLENQESGYRRRCSPTREFNLLQISPNWTLNPRRKWALVIICQRKEVHCKGYTASVAHPWALAVYDQFSLMSMEIPYVSVLYNQLKTHHLARIPFNLGGTGYTASVAQPWVLAVYHEFWLKSMEIPYVSVLYNLLKAYHLALIP